MHKQGEDAAEPRFFTNASVRGILHNPFYTGQVKHQDKLLGFAGVAALLPTLDRGAGGFLVVASGGSGEGERVTTGDRLLPKLWVVY